MGEGEMTKPWSCSRGQRGKKEADTGEIQPATYEGERGDTSESVSKKRTYNGRKSGHSRFL